MPLTEPAFVETREHRRFVEFCEACRRERYVGLCFGPPGVGKTMSARRHARWDVLAAHAFASEIDDEQLADVAAQRTLLYTPAVVNAPGSVRAGLQAAAERLLDVAREPGRRALGRQLEAQSSRRAEHRARLQSDYDWLQAAPSERPVETLAPDSPTRGPWPAPADLVIIDEADRLKPNSLEQVRDMFDRADTGVALIGMPGFEKRLARQPQLYSRIGFVHSFQPLPAEELEILLTERLDALGIELNAARSIAPDALAAIHRATAGNFRLVVRLLGQVTRIMALNGLDQITLAAVEAARESLVIGAV
ncbi:MAG: AAA family ATPase [Caulobacteraceae bacterium]|nr:AAA family ATPase [Caulobacteraceae bacterium]